VRKLLTALLLLLLAGGLFSIWRHRSSEPILDDAKTAGKTASDFPETASHAFDAMDGGAPLSEAEMRGRNTWLLWTAGDQVFWDRMAQHGLGTADLLKAIDSRLRTSRFKEMGLMNQPGFEAAAKPDKYGLWVDAGNVENGVDPAVYGRPTGVVGLRLYSNPAFEGDAIKEWDAVRYYSDPNYYNDPKLVRPYVVGMSCGFCHVAFNPVKPPSDPEHPGWENLSSTIGNQYLIANRVFAPNAGADSYVYQLLHSWAPGTIDTSFIATDNLNNPSNINAIYALSARAAEARREAITGGALSLPDENNFMGVPHVLKDGADSVGLIGALSRVYVSIGEYSQEWLRDHLALVGGTPQRPFDIEKAQKNSVYWQATAARFRNVAVFLTMMEGPRLADSPGGSSFVTRDVAILKRGAIVFAENCARCHSSKQPSSAMDKSSNEYLNWMRSEVTKPDFLKDNFLSTDERIPVTVVETNAARALATNATAGHVWDNFSSATYKGLPAVGTIRVLNLNDGSKSEFRPTGGGPGYYRVPSLVGVWATAPCLHNNAIGTFTGDSSVAGRMRAFNDGMEKLLWPERRANTGSVVRTTAESFIEIPAVYLPTAFQPLARDGYLRLGPIPKGTPVNLMANANLDLSDDGMIADRVRLIARVQANLLRIKTEKLDDEAAGRLFKELEPELMRISKCPDFVEDRGHLFGSGLPDADKQALIEFLKTF